MLVANRDILIGEEVTITYLADLKASPDERNESLMKWRFTCHCDACDGEEAYLHTKRRLRMAEIYEKVFHKTNRKSTSPKVALIRAAEMMELCREEQLLGADLLVSYRRCTDSAYNAGELMKALEYAQTWRKTEKMIRGPNYESKAQPWLDGVLQEEKLLKDPRYKREISRAEQEIKKAEELAKKEAAKQAKKLEQQEAKRKEVEAQRKAAEEEKLKAAEAAEVDLIKQRNEAAAKADSKKAKEAAKNAVKKAKRVIRAPVKDKAELLPRVDSMLDKMTPDQILALASNMADATAAGEVLEGELAKRLE